MDLCRSDAESDLLMSMLRERAPKLHSMWLGFDEDQDLRSLPRSLLTLELCPDFDIWLDELDLTEGLSGMIALTHLKFGSAHKENCFLTLPEMPSLGQLSARYSDVGMESLGNSPVCIACLSIIIPRQAAAKSFASSLVSVSLNSADECSLQELLQSSPKLEELKIHEMSCEKILMQLSVPCPLKCLQVQAVTQDTLQTMALNTPKAVVILMLSRHPPPSVHLPVGSELA